VVTGLQHPVSSEELGRARGGWRDVCVLRSRVDDVEMATHTAELRIHSVSVPDATCARKGRAFTTSRRVHRKLPKTRMFQEVITGIAATAKRRAVPRWSDGATPAIEHTIFDAGGALRLAMSGAPSLRGQQAADVAEKIMVSFGGWH
jgi:hypothetical protein